MSQRQASGRPRALSPTKLSFAHARFVSDTEGSAASAGISRRPSRSLQDCLLSRVHVVLHRKFQNIFSTRQAGFT